MNDAINPTAQTDTDAADTKAGAPTQGRADQTQGQPRDTQTGAQTPSDKGTGQKADTAGQKTGAPESYARFTVPEGMGEMTDESFKLVSEFARENGLSQEAAQAGVNLHLDLLKQYQEASESEFTRTREKWAEEARNDEEFGGQSFDENVGLAHRVLNTFGEKARDGNGKLIYNPETGLPLTKLGIYLNETGLGNHPEMIRFMVRVGKSISEDKLVLPRAEEGGETDAASVLYPSMKK